METLQPRITLQNLEGPQWQLRIEHDFGNGERIDFTALVRKDRTVPLPQLVDEALDRLVALSARIRNTGS